MAQGTTTTVIVTAADLDNTSSDPAVVATDGLNKWFMYNDTNDTIDNTLGSFVVGPGTPPNGRGSIQFTLGASPFDRKNIATYQFSGTSLASITQMSFTAYSHSGVAGPTESPFLNFNVDFSGSSNAFQGRLVYVPSANGPVPQDTWNTFDVITCGFALWTWSHYASNGNKWPDGNTSQYRTWNDIKAAFPNARLLPVGGWLGIRVGEPGPTNYTANIDSFTLGTATGTTTFDFEPTPSLQARAFGLQSTNPANGPFGDVSIPPNGGNQTVTVASVILPAPINIVATGITDTASGALTPAPAHADASSMLTSLMGQGIVATGINVTAHADLSTSNGVLSGKTIFATFVGDGLVQTGYSPAPNTMITLPGQGILTLNEQTLMQQANNVSIVVNGLHFHFTQGPQAGTDILIGHAEAALTFP
jgi:hypothetical protein